VNKWPPTVGGWVVVGGGPEKQPGDATHGFKLLSGPSVARELASPAAVSM
jgi:hypothetical protein